MEANGAAESNSYGCEIFIAKRRKRAIHGILKGTPKAAIAAPYFQPTRVLINPENGFPLTSDLSTLGGCPSFGVSELDGRTLLPSSPLLATGVFPTPSREDFDRVLRKYRATKAPGPDGLNVFVLNKLPVAVKDLVYDTIVELWEGAEWPEEWLFSYTFLLPKSSSASKPSDFRPISLIGLVAKIFGCLLNAQLQDWANRVIHHSQKGFRRGHRGTDHVIELLQAQIPSHRIFVDFAKAFDSAVQGFLWQILTAYGLHEHNVTLVRNLYQRASSAPLVNGRAPVRFYNVRGVKQGCPLSPTLFGLYIDPLLRRAAATMSPWKSATLSAFADDILLHARKAAAARAGFATILRYGRKMGLKINASKSEFHCEGTPDMDSIDVDDVSLPRQPTTAHYKYLGVWIFNERNPQGAMELVKEVIISFFRKLESLCLPARPMIVAINTCLMPKLVYRLFLQPDVAHNWSAINSLVWSEIAKRTTLPSTTPAKARHGPIEMGGLDLQHLPTMVATRTAETLHVYWSTRAITKSTPVMTLYELAAKTLQLRLLGIHGRDIGQWVSRADGALLPDNAAPTGFTADSTKRYCHVLACGLELSRVVNPGFQAEAFVDGSLLNKMAGSGALVHLPGEKSHFWMFTELWALLLTLKFCCERQISTYTYTKTTLQL
eukprot:TRINITY_DN6793_c0_g1_i13.p1 TRINITY_DN6793_c0_g1~~TRINITY_DN6793_c0_g1_i13.p1  ORF type:complete len:662 (+),score=41.86 TRINITY_DN6793_c0_g1_i13:2050-4035(+)